MMHSISKNYCVCYPTDVQSDSKTSICPVAVLAPLGLNVTLNCTAVNASELCWDVNARQIANKRDIQFLRGKFIYATLDPGPNGNTRFLEMIITATTVNNGTNVKCIGFTDNDNRNPDESDTVTFRVYSRPSAPQKLSVTALGPLKLNVTWLPPYSLPEVKVTYIVNVTAVSKSEPCNSGELSDPFYILEGEDSTCDLFTISLTAINNAGVSDPTIKHNISLPTCKCCY